MGTDLNAHLNDQDRFALGATGGKERDRLIVNLVTVLLFSILSAV